MAGSVSTINGVPVHIAITTTLYDRHTFERAIHLPVHMALLHYYRQPSVKENYQSPNLSEVPPLPSARLIVAKEATEIKRSQDRPPLLRSFGLDLRNRDPSPCDLCVCGTLNLRSQTWQSSRPFRLSDTFRGSNSASFVFTSLLNLLLGERLCSCRSKFSLL